MAEEDTASVVAPGSPRFALHTLGWRAFQDLCATVLREIWGQSVQAFADSNDAGRDGAFYGMWQKVNNSKFEEFQEGPFVLQCKHTKLDNVTLSSSMLSEEFDKVSGLVERGVCNTYILLTNARITGTSEEGIRKKLRDRGVAYPVILGGQWLCDIIAARRSLRMFVPRVYGLGDLSQILDERAYAQASLLLSSASDQVSTFVPTASYRKAANSLRDHNFVLLLGEPAVGKSTTALMLAMSAADSWGCVTVKARTSDEVIGHWNPHEKRQFFWIDDAFGSVRHEQHLTESWTRNLPHIMSAVNNGCRIVMTSRTYIYREARPLLKTYAFPVLRESEVTVDVESLSRNERQEILYNQIVAGDQPKDVRAKMKPHLRAAAEVHPFRPEVARRLGLQAFTRSVPFDRVGILAFMAHSHEFLGDIYSQLDSNAQAALVLTYTSTAHKAMTVPLKLSPAQHKLIDHLGATVSATIKAVDSLTDTFLRREFTKDCSDAYAFKHPTLREAFANWLADQNHILPTILEGIDDEVLLDSTDCLPVGNSDHAGKLLRIPPTLHSVVATRLSAIFAKWPEGSCWTGDALRYLGNECSDTMLNTYMRIDPDLPTRLLEFEPYCSYVPEPRVLRRLHEAGVLSEANRQAAVNRMAQLAVEYLDTAWIQEAAWKILLTEVDRTRITYEVRTSLVPHLDHAIIDGWTGDIFWLSETGPSGSRVEALENALTAYRDEFQRLNDNEAVQAFEYAIQLHRQRSEAETSNPNIDNSSDTATSSASLGHNETSRSIFSDVDEGD